MNWRFQPWNPGLRYAITGDQAPKNRYMPLYGDHDLPNNTCQAPAAVKIGVTLLFSESSLLPAPLSFRKPALQRAGIGK
jgi:hypothetical protein